jgi:hypothetical protein
MKVAWMAHPPLLPQEYLAKIRTESYFWFEFVVTRCTLFLF